MSATVVPEILAALEPYLEDKDRAWQAQPEGSREPTLPCKRENGVLSIHVGNLVKELGINPEWRQHFKKRELRAVVNAVCRTQGLKGIGEDGPVADADAAVKKVIVRQGADNKRLAEQLVEAQATILRQRQRIAELEGQLGLAQADGVLLRTAPPRKA
ncbi:MAG TPA: hypothetical protein VGE72_17915 [Azospirillum sp.]